MSDSKNDQPFGSMTNWVIEKADNSLGNAASICDKLRTVLPNLSPLDEEFMEQDLFSLIVDTAKLSAFAHNNLPAFTREWAELIMNQGYDRFLEYRERVAGRIPIDQPPARWPISIQKAIDLFDQLKAALTKASPEDLRVQTYVWQPILEVSRQLRETRFERLRKLGLDLADLVDKFVVSNDVSWAEFISRSKTRINTDKVAFIEKDAPPPVSDTTGKTDNSPATNQT